MKRILKYSLVYGLLLAFLASTTGVFYVVHHCSSEHKDYIFFASATADCEHHHHHHPQTGQEDQRPCTCNSPLSHQQIEDESCCVNHYHFAKLETDFIYSSQNIVSFAVPVLCILFTNSELISICSTFFTLHFSDFPPHSGFYDRDIFLSSICQFLI